MDSDLHRAGSLSPEDLDALLTLQLLVAWAGEADSDPPRLGWWRTSMVDEFGGRDLLSRLAPRTFEWAVLEAARAAAKKVDAAARARTADADQLVTLFRFGFLVDERLDDRLAEHKRSGVRPEEALPRLCAIASWDRAAFEAWLRDVGTVEHKATPAGRQLKGELPSSLALAGRSLAAGLLPLAPEYPVPHFRSGR